MKAYTAAPPDVLRVNEKNIRAYYIPNCVGVIITTNYKDSLYLPPDDRRTYVAWSEKNKEDFSPRNIGRHCGSGMRTAASVTLPPSWQLVTSPASTLRHPPPKTQAFWTIVDINRSPEDSELADRIDAMSNPNVLTVSMLIDHRSDSELVNVAGALVEPDDEGFETVIFAEQLLGGDLW
jgi:hypothetical protein